MAEPKYQQTIYFPKSIRQQLKILAAKHDMTVSEVATKAVELLLQEEKEKNSQQWRLESVMPVKLTWLNRHLLMYN